ncbi:Protein TIPIN [Trichostrongylus colubriformis]|uniref:TIMELESS-interacting protein n=1 Tax=Trichostrongylus colubriformis TaxID=6319 RepID=A0AAN8FYN6_TRICO
MDDEFGEINDFFGHDFSDNEAGEGEEATDDQVLNNLLEKENQEVVKKRAKSRPQPKLNEATLTGAKGIKALQDSFQNFKPDPKKDPYDNLAVMLKKYEHWAHVMFPKLKFEDVVNRCEVLGDKRAVKVYMMKSRLGMPLTDEDFAPVRRQKGDDIILTENNEDDAGRSSDDENYYDPLESAASNGGNSNKEKPAERSASASTTTAHVTGVMKRKNWRWLMRSWMISTCDQKFNPNEQDSSEHRDAASLSVSQFGLYSVAFARVSKAVIASNSANC